jgi:hypothetical protein
MMVFTAVTLDQRYQLTLFAGFVDAFAAKRQNNGDKRHQQK